VDVSCNGNRLRRRVEKEEARLEMHESGIEGQRDGKKPLTALGHQLRLLRGLGETHRMQRSKQGDANGKLTPDGIVFWRGESRIVNPLSWSPPKNIDRFRMGRDG
jgi:hypothetical protein